MKIGDLVYHKSFKLLGVGLIIDSALEKRQHHGSTKDIDVKMFYVQFSKSDVYGQKRRKHDTRREPPGIYTFAADFLCEISCLGQ